MTHEPTIGDVLEAIQVFATNVDERFNGVDARLDRMEGRQDKMENELDSVKNELKGVRASMVTKDYLDDKLADLRGDLIVLARKQNRKLSEVVLELQKSHALSEDTAKRLLALEPFPLP